MNKKVLNIVETQDNIVNHYLKIWAYDFGLTDREFITMKILISTYLNLLNDGVKKQYIPKMLFDKEVVNSIKDKLNLSRQNWLNLKMNLKKKQALIEYGELVTISPILIPLDSLTFNFTVK